MEHDASVYRNQYDAEAVRPQEQRPWEARQDTKMYMYGMYSKNKKQEINVQRCFLLKDANM